MLSKLLKLIFPAWGFALYFDTGGGGSPPAPDYTPMAAASEKSAQIAADLGQKQLDENKRQYDLNQQTIAPLIAKQGTLMDQQMAQSQDYYDYNKSASRPLEAEVNKEAMAAGSDQLQGEAADRAVADSRAGQTANANMIARQGIRYGFSPEKMAAAGGDLSVNQGLAEATAANGARTNELNRGFGMKMNAASMYRGLPQASTSAAGVASGAGTAGVNGTLGASGQYLNGMSAGTGTIMSGQQLAQQGLGSILSSQTSAFGSGQQNAGNTMSGLGSLVGAGAKLWSASDRRLKDNIVLVGTDEATGLNLYEFNYKTNPKDRFRGVMADEVLVHFPAAVIETSDGYLAVDYSRLGIEMVEV